MSYAAKVLKDSTSPDGVRLTTMEVTFPRIVLSEFNTHRMFSRNSSSSRAIPVEKRIASIDVDPFVPDVFGKNQKGMQASEDLDAEYAVQARKVWMLAKETAVKHSRELAKFGVHKQLANRLVEPFCWQTVIVTATEWDNWYGLRSNVEAQPEIRVAADMMLEVFKASTPQELKFGEWHLPLIQPDEIVIPDNSPEWNESVGFQCSQLTVEYAKRVSVGRCARISYLTHDGVRNTNEDVELCNRLLLSGHMSPFEHVARPATQHDIASWGVNSYAPFFGNFRGWMQFRKEIPNESVFKNRSINRNT